MPLNAIPPTTTVENLDLKVKAAKDQCFVDVGFWGGVIPNNEKDLKPLVEAGVKGFKSFLCELHLGYARAIWTERTLTGMVSLNRREWS